MYGLILASVVAVGTLFLAPSWDHPTICHLAAVLALVTVALLWRTRATNGKGERTLIAWFLGAMPVVYWIASPTYLQGVGVLIFGGLAAYGYLRNPLMLAAGVATHGLLWDAAHLVVPAPGVPPWYAVACLLVDVTLSLYLYPRLRPNPAILS